MVKIWSEWNVARLVLPVSAIVVLFWTAGLWTVPFPPPCGKTSDENMLQEPPHTIPEVQFQTLLGGWLGGVVPACLSVIYLVMDCCSLM